MRTCDVATSGSDAATRAKIKTADRADTLCLVMGVLLRPLLNLREGIGGEN
jgi:hypothetical protein